MSTNSNIGGFNAKISINSEEVKQDTASIKESIKGVDETVNKTVLSFKDLREQLKGLHKELSEVNKEAKSFGINNSKTNPLKSELTEMFELYKGVKDAAQEKSRGAFGVFEHLKDQMNAFKSKFQTATKGMEKLTTVDPKTLDLGVLRGAAEKLRDRYKNTPLGNDIGSILTRLVDVEHPRSAGDYMSELRRVAEEYRRPGGTADRASSILKLQGGDKDALQEIEKLKGHVYEDFMKLGSGGFMDLFQDYLGVASKPSRAGRPRKNPLPALSEADAPRITEDNVKQKSALQLLLEEHEAAKKRIKEIPVQTPVQTPIVDAVTKVIKASEKVLKGGTYGPIDTRIQRLDKTYWQNFPGATTTGDTLMSQPRRNDIVRDAILLSDDRGEAARIASEKNKRQLTFAQLNRQNDELMLGLFGETKKFPVPDMSKYKHLWSGRMTTNPMGEPKFEEGLKQKGYGAFLDLKYGAPITKVVATLAAESFKLVGVFGAVAGSIAAVAKSGQSYLQQQQRLAYAFDISGQSAAGFQRMASVLGEDTLSIENRYELISSRLGEARNAYNARNPFTGLSFEGNDHPIITAVRRTGLDPGALFNNKLDDQIDMLYEALNRMPDAVSRIAVQREIFGRDFQLLTTLMQAGAGFQRSQARRASMFGAVGTKGELEGNFQSSISINSSWADAKNFFQSITRLFADTFVPSFAKWASAFMDLIAPFWAGARAIGTLVGTMVKLNVGLGATVLAKAIELLSPALEGLASLFNQVGDGFVRLGQKIINSIDFAITGKTGGNENRVTTRFRNIFEDAGKGIATLLDDLGDGIANLIHRLPPGVLRNADNVLGGRDITPTVTPQENLRIFESSIMRQLFSWAGDENLADARRSILGSSINRNTIMTEGAFNVENIRRLPAGEQNQMLRQMADLLEAQGRREFEMMMRVLVEDIASAGMTEIEVQRRRIRMLGGTDRMIEQMDEVYRNRERSRYTAQVQQTIRERSFARSGLMEQLRMMERGRLTEGTYNADTPGAIQRSVELENMQSLLRNLSDRTGLDLSLGEGVIAQLREANATLTAMERTVRLTEEAAKIRMAVRSPENNLVNQLEKLSAMLNGGMLDRNQFNIAMFRELAQFAGPTNNIEFPHAMQFGSVEAASAIARIQREQVDPLQRVEQVLLGIRELQARQVQLGAEMADRIRRGEIPIMVNFGARP